MPVLVRAPSLALGALTPSVPVPAAATARPGGGRADTPTHPAHRTRPYEVGDEVQVRSGGSIVIVRGYAANGEVVCELGDRTFDLPELLLRIRGSRPVRRGRKPGIRPRQNAEHF